ncbi:MAG TPA: hypothetical protein VF320_03565 [Acidimicrobiales bacterium]
MTKTVPGPTVTKTTTVPGPTATVTAPPAPASGDLTEGLYVVGVDIAPSTYHTAGSDTNGCYWERLSGLSGSMSDTIANDLINGPTTVTIYPTDKAFKTSGCLPWTRVG